MEGLLREGCVMQAREESSNDHMESARTNRATSSLCILWWQGAALLALLPLAASCSSRAVNLHNSTSTVDRNMRDRTLFFRGISLIRPGMTGQDVRNLIGEPDVIGEPPSAAIDWFDVVLPGQSLVDLALAVSSMREEWRYGCSENQRFPTLARVYLDHHGRVVGMACGSVERPHNMTLGENELRSLLVLLDSVQEPDAQSYSPICMIRIVNKLQSLGKDCAADVLCEYCRLQPSSSKRLNAYLIGCVLFGNNSGPDGALFRVFAVSTPRPPRSHDEIPTFPILVFEGVPLFVSYTRWYEGPPPGLQDYLAYFGAQGKFLEAPLLPPDNPLSLLPSLERSPAWVFGAAYLRLNGHEAGLDESFCETAGRALVASQLLKLVHPAFSVVSMRCAEEGYPPAWAVTHALAHWDELVADVSRLGLHWDAAQCRYAKADCAKQPARVLKR